MFNRYRFSWSAVAVTLLAGLAACSGGGSPSAACAAQEIGLGAGATTTVVADSDLASSVARTFCADFVFMGAGTSVRAVDAVLSSRDASCIADKLIASLGASRVRELGLGAWPWSLVSFGISNNMSIDRAEAEKIVDTFRSCSSHWELLMIKSVTAGADAISDKSAQCVAAKLDDNDARSIFAGEMDRAYENTKAFGDAIQPLVSAMKACLTPDELGRMDWN